MAVAMLALVSGVLCVAQTYYGGLRGTVTDPTGQASQWHSEVEE